MTSSRVSPPSLVAILGSATPPGRLHRAVDEALVRVQTRRGVTTRMIDLATVSIAAADGRPPHDLADDTAAVVAAVEDSRIVLLATPVYRGSFTGTLKNLLDHVPGPALRETVVAVVSMGATLHHTLGAERHLRDVLAFYGALVVPTAAYLTSADFDSGAPLPAAAGTLDELLDSAAELADRIAGAHLGPPPLGAR